MHDDIRKQEIENELDSLSQKSDHTNPDNDALSEYEKRRDEYEYGE